MHRGKKKQVNGLSEELTNLLT